MKHSFSCILIFCFTNIFGQNELKIGDKSKQIEFSKSFPKNYEIPKDKPLFLDFWATWCGPCVAGLIEHKELVKKYSKIIEFIAITDSTSKNVQKFIINNKFENKFIIDKDSSTFGNYGVNGIPYAFLIDTNKIIIWSGYSRDFKESVIEDFIKNNEIKASPRKKVINKNWYISDTTSKENYELVIVNQKKLNKHKTILTEKNKYGKGNFSNAPESEGYLSVINYSLEMFTKRVGNYFTNKALKNTSISENGFDFIKLQFLDFESMNKELLKKYGIIFKLKE